MIRCLKSICVEGGGLAALMVTLALAPCAAAQNAPAESEKTAGTKQAVRAGAETTAGAQTQDTQTAPKAAREAKIKADTDKLCQLIQELKDEVAKSNKDTLSVAVVKKAAEIEKLAKSLKEQMRPQ